MVFSTWAFCNHEVYTTKRKRKTQYWLVHVEKMLINKLVQHSSLLKLCNFISIRLLRKQESWVLPGASPSSLCLSTSPHLSPLASPRFLTSLPPPLFFALQPCFRVSASPVLPSRLRVTFSINPDVIYSCMISASASRLLVGCKPPAPCVACAAHLCFVTSVCLSVSASRPQVWLLLPALWLTWVISLRISASLRLSVSPFWPRIASLPPTIVFCSTFYASSCWLK